MNLLEQLLVLLGRKGLTFLPELKGLKPSSFLSVEAISWISQNVDGVNSKEQAIQLCQVSGFVFHIVPRFSIEASKIVRVQFNIEQYGAILFRI